MNVVKCNVPHAQLTAEALSVPLVRIPNGSGHGHFNAKSGWINGLSNARVRPGETWPWITQAVQELADEVHHHHVVQILLNKLDPGALLDTHRDGYPQNDRYHLPIVTNRDAYWWDELEGRLSMSVGYWYGPVPYCGILHSAGNPGPTDRLHLVVDFAHEKGN